MLHGQVCSCREMFLFSEERRILHMWQNITKIKLIGRIKIYVFSCGAQIFILGSAIALSCMYFYVCEMVAEMAPNFALNFTY